MRATLLAAALAVLTIGLVIFIFIDLHAAQAPSAAPATIEQTPVAPAPLFVPPPPPPVVTPPPVATAPPIAPPTAAAAPSHVQLPIDPMDQVLQGKTRREWRAIYAAKQKRTLSEMERHQAIIERAENGEEPDPIQLGEAHTRMRELKDELRVEQEELQHIEAQDPDPQP